jgi:hypothetical protein
LVEKWLAKRRGAGRISPPKQLELLAMLNFIRAASACALIAGLSTPAISQAPTVVAPGAPSAATAAKADPNEVVCQKQEVVGSRLAVRRICKTRAEWADLQIQDRQEIERVQVRRGMPGN